MHLAVTEMMWTTGGIEAERCAQGRHGAWQRYRADRDAQKNEAHVMLRGGSEYGRAIRVSADKEKVRERERDRDKQRWAFLMLRLGEPRGNLTRLRSGRLSKRETLDYDVNPSLHE